jgi:hypothetical protein
MYHDPPVSASVYVLDEPTHITGDPPVSGPAGALTNKVRLVLAEQVPLVTT